MSRRDDNTQVAASVPFESSELDWTDKDNVQEAIEDCYIAAKGIKTFPFELHYVSGTGGGTNMNNGSFFRVRPGTFSSGSYAGYPACFPLQIPFKCKLNSIVLTFASASYDWTNQTGPIRFELELRDHVQNGSSVQSRILVEFGSFTGSFTGYGFFRYELFLNNGFTYISGDDEIDYGQLIGVRFVKSTGGLRNINRFADIVMKLNFEEV